MLIQKQLLKNIEILMRRGYRNPAHLRFEVQKIILSTIDACKILPVRPDASKKLFDARHLYI